MKQFSDVLVAYKKTWVVLTLVIALIFILGQIPAVWGGYILTRGTGLALTGITGSVWDGRASLASIKVQSDEYSLGALTWKLTPWSLISRCANVTTKLEMQHFDGQICARSNGEIRLLNADVGIPAELLQNRIPVPVQGNFSAHINDVRLTGNVLSALDAKITWNNARVSAGPSWIDLGNVAAEVADDRNNGIVAKVFSLSGPIDLALDVQLLAPSGGSVSGRFAAPSQLIDSFGAREILSMFAQQERVDEEGRSHYSVNMPL